MRIALAAVVAFAVSLVTVRILERRGGAMGLLDIPNDRSLHVDPRPRGGGVGILAGVMAAFAVFLWSGAAIDSRLVVVLAASLVIALTGLWDDVRRLPALPRLIVQVAMSVAVVFAVGPLVALPLPAPADVPLGAFGPLLTVVWLVGVTNFVNFMDGADGLAAGQGTISLTLLAWAVWPSPTAAVALAAAAATAGFLARNWSPARIFLGDVGSAWLGFVLAALPLTAPAGVRERLIPMMIVSLGLFLVDPVLTLVRRGWRGHAIGVAHRDHAYQRLILRRGRHAAVVGALLAGAMVLSLFAAGGFLQPSLAWPSVAAVCAISAVESWWAARD